MEVRCINHSHFHSLRGKKRATLSVIHGTTWHFWFCSAVVSFAPTSTWPFSWLNGTSNEGGGGEEGEERLGFPGVAETLCPG